MDNSTGPATAVRDRKAEKFRARQRQASRIGEICDKRQDGTLGDSYVKMAHAILLCSLPYGPTDERQITRTARLGDGSTLQVTFTCGYKNVPMPYGADRHLLNWILDRAIRIDSPKIPWKSAYEYQQEVGITKCGKNNRDLANRFSRLSGLVVGVQRTREEATEGKLYSIVEDFYLPSSITGKPDQELLPGFEDGFGISLNITLFNDIKLHNSVIPKAIWLNQHGPYAVQDMVLWLYWRCYSAETESVIPWSAIDKQFGNDSNPWRIKQHAKQAVGILNTLWPRVVLSVIAPGVAVDYSQPVLPNDRSKNRYRRL